MNKNLFQPGEVKTKSGEFKLGLVHTFEEPVEERYIGEPQRSGYFFDRQVGNFELRLGVHEDGIVYQVACGALADGLYG